MIIPVSSFANNNVVATITNKICVKQVGTENKKALAMLALTKKNNQGFVNVLMTPFEKPEGIGMAIVGYPIEKMVLALEAELNEGRPLQLMYHDHVTNIAKPVFTVVAVNNLEITMTISAAEGMESFDCTSMPRYIEE